MLKFVRKRNPKSFLSSSPFLTWIWKPIKLGYHLLYSKEVTTDQIHFKKISARSRSSFTHVFHYCCREDFVDVTASLIEGSRSLLERLILSHWRPNEHKPSIEVLLNYDEQTYLIHSSTSWSIVMRMQFLLRNNIQLSKEKIRRYILAYTSYRVIENKRIMNLDDYI